MASEKNPEVVGCDASIMKNVWEIREREYAVKLQMEQERIEKSALPSINQDWLNRLLAKQGHYKRVERKAKPVENQAETTNVWKSKPTQVPPTPPRGPGSGQFGRPGGQKRGFSTPAANNNDKKGQDKNFNKLRSLMSITQTQPSAMVWGKSWKYNKSLPLPEESSATKDWGQCWMFATHQPYTEAGKPWLNGPNMMDLESLRFWRKTDDRVVESQELDLSPSDEWQMSWRKYDQSNKTRDTASDGNDLSKSGLFFLLEETQHYNEALCSSEWSESWRATKPGSQQDNLAVLNDGQMNESIANKQDEDREKWAQSWRFINHSGGKNVKLNEVKTSDCDWANSWSAAMVVFNNHKNSDHSSRPDHHNSYDYGNQQKESHFYKDLLVSNEEKYRQRLLQLCNEFKALSEWSKSWEVTKNNSKPCVEIEKVLKEAAAPVQKNVKGQDSALGKTDSRYEQLNNNVIHHPRESTQSYLLQMKHMENVSFASEWRDCWKTLKHRMRAERRRMRPDPSKPFNVSEKGENIKPTVSEWKDSMKFTCQPLQQQPEFWQQGWSAMPQIRVDRARDQGHFAPVELPMNGPTTEGSWRESWRFSKAQNRSEPVQGRAQTSKRSDTTSHHSDDSHRHWSVGHRSHAWSGSDWQDAWMVSETQFHHDKPSFIQWREAWKCSAFNTEHWAEEAPRENGIHVLMEIQPQKEKLSRMTGKAKMSRSFDNQIFRERYPETEWNASWRAGRSSTTQDQRATANGHGSKWGISFRLANPMPQIERPWVESSPNPSYYTAMWSRKNYIQTNTKFSNNPTAFKLWGNSYQFLHGDNKHNKDKTKSKEPVDPRVIITKKTQTRRHLYTTMEKEKQSDRKWVGCHLLGKTQPRPKRGPGSTKKLMAEDKNTDKFCEEWAESWRYFVRPSSLKKQMPVKSLSGWNESWKFLLPLYQPMNVAKAK